MATTTDNYKIRVSQTGAKQTQKAMKRLGTSVMGLTATFIGGAGLYLAFKKVLSVSIEQEKAVRRLTAVAGPYTAVLQRQAAAYQKVTIHGDEVLMQVQRLLIQLGAETVNEVDKGTKATIELASALGMDLQSAARLVGQAMAGNVQTLARYIPSVRNLTKAEIAEGKALDLVISKLGGSAAAEANTLYGSLKQAGNAFGDLLEVIGAETGLNALLRYMADNVRDLSVELQRMGKGDWLNILADIADLGLIVGGSATADRLRASAKGYIRAAAVKRAVAFAAEPQPGGKLPGAGKGTGKGAGKGGGIAEVGGFEGLGRFEQMVDFFGEKAGAAGDLASNVIENAREYAGSVSEAIDTVFADAQQARTDNWIAATSFRLEKDYEMQIEALAQQEKLYNQSMQIMQQAATGTASLMGQTFANMLGGQEEQGKKFLQGILSLLGTLAIARGNVVVADALAEAYMSSGVSLSALAPGLALIALGTTLKTGAYLAGGAGGGGFAAGGYAGPASGAPGADGGQRSITININSGIVYDEGGLGKMIQSTLDRAALEGQI